MSKKHQHFGGRSLSRRKANYYRFSENAESRLDDLVAYPSDMKPDFKKSYRIKMHSVGQRYTVLSPLAFGFSGDSEPKIIQKVLIGETKTFKIDKSDTSHDRRHAATWKHSKNSVDTGTFEIERKVSDSGVAMFSDLQGNDHATERYPIRSRASWTKVAYHCPKCGNSHILHVCEPDGLEHSIQTPRPVAKSTVEKRPPSQFGGDMTKSAGLAYLKKR